LTKFDLYAGFPNGKISTKNRDITVKAGYPGGWAIPRVCVAVIISGLSPTKIEKLKK